MAHVMFVSNVKKKKCAKNGVIINCFSNLTIYDNSMFCSITVQREHSFKIKFKNKDLKVNLGLPEFNYNLLHCHSYTLPRTESVLNSYKSHGKWGL